MLTPGSEVREIRIRDAIGAYRVIYIATLADAIRELHALHKKPQKERSAISTLPPRACESLDEDGNDESSNLRHAWPPLRLVQKRRPR